MPQPRNRFATFLENLHITRNQRCPREKGCSVAQMNLRPYQLDAETAVFQEWETVNATAVVHATGLGKTELAIRIIKRVMPKRVLFLAHRRELIMQPKERLFQREGIEADVEMGELRADTHWLSRKNVVISSVQTQFHRKFAPKDFDYLILDEMHHYVGAPAFNEVVQHYRTGNPDLKILGLTATPNRTDGKAMGQLFDSVAHAYEISPAIRDGWLVNIKPNFVPVLGLDYSHIEDMAGELNGRQLAEIIDQEQVIQGMIQPTIESAWGCPEQTLKNYPISEWKKILDGFGDPLYTLVFCTTVRQAEMFTNILNRIHDGLAAMVCGDKKLCSEERREQVGKDFKNGPLRFVCNVDVYSEGYDNPFLQQLVMARPLKSLLKYTQCLGRGTRAWPGVIDDLIDADARKSVIAASPKPFLRVIDFVGNTGTHKIVNCIDALGGDMEPTTLERAVKECKEGRQGMVDELLKTAEELQEEDRKRRLEEEAKKHKIVLKSNYKTIAVDPFDVLQITPAKERSWDVGKPISIAQMEMLRRNGINPEHYPTHQQRQLLNELGKRIRTGKATFKQVNWLKKHGYNGDGFTFKAAREMMDRWAKNGWKRPPENPEPVSASDNVPF